MLAPSGRPSLRGTGEKDPQSSGDRGLALPPVGGGVSFERSGRARHSGTGRRIGALWPFNETDPDGQAVFEAFRSGLRELGWGGATIESRWGGGNVETTKAHAAELVRLAPPVLARHALQRSGRFEGPQNDPAEGKRPYRAGDWGPGPKGSVASGV